MRIFRPARGLKWHAMTDADKPVKRRIPLSICGIVALPVEKFERGVGEPTCRNCLRGLEGKP